MEKHERLMQARIKAGFRKQIDAVKQFGWSRPVYSHHENGTRNFNDGHATTYAKAFKTTPEWLLYGKDKKNTPVPMLDYPIVPWDELAQYCETDHKDSTLSHTESYFTHKTYADYSFALKMQNDSMARTGSPSFQEGSLVLFEYGAEAKPNDYALVRQDEEYIFRQLIKDGSRWMLKPLNPSYGMEQMHDNSAIIAIARQVIMEM